MAKPKKWDTMTPEEQEAWREKTRENDRKYYEANRDKVINQCRKYYEANRDKYCQYRRKWKESNRERQRESERKLKNKRRQQSAADQFFILAGSAEQLSKAVSNEQAQERNSAKNMREM